MFIHGSCTTADICYKSAAAVLSERYHCVLVHLDGHEAGKKNSFISLNLECEKIEHFVHKHYGGKLFGLTGLSLGATICVHLMTRGNITVQKILLDGVYCVDVGFLQTWVNILTCIPGIKYLKMGGNVPDILVEKIFGKGNTSVVKMLFEGMSAASVKNVCTQVYRYRISSGISKCSSDILCIRGEYEPIPEKTFVLLKQYLPHIKELVIPDCGHAQLLHEHGEMYCELADDFFGKKSTSVEQKAEGELHSSEYGDIDRHSVSCGDHAGS